MTIAWERRGLDSVAYRSAWILLGLLAVAVLTRAGRVGDPAIQMDEQFYLLVADRMWHGALPYVDIWDRKPILLFLIYAALRPLSPDGIVAYQVGALLFATATAFMIFLIAQRFANLSGACLAGVGYLLYLPVLSGVGGQSPVFYNLFMAIGAWEIIRAGEACDKAAILRFGLRSMLWVGLAIQVKYTAAVEGVAFGLWLIVLLTRLNSAPRHIAACAALWVLVAVTPTLVAAGFYALIGHGQEFWRDNFISIFQRHDPDGLSSIGFLRVTVAKLAPLLLVVTWSIPLLLRRQTMTGPLLFLLLWFAFGVADLFAVGNYYDHYALPLLVPAMLICAPVLGTAIGGATGIALFVLFFVWATGFPVVDWKKSDESRVSAMVEAVRPYAARGCIYLNDGPTIVYLLTHSCLPTRYVFPGHLNDAIEAGATDATRNMAELLALRPSAIFVPDRPLDLPRNLVTAAMLDASLASNYRLVTTLPDVNSGRQQNLYVRRDFLPQRETQR
jgi:hypothetical protein